MWTTALGWVIPITELQRLCTVRFHTFIPPSCGPQKYNTHKFVQKLIFATLSTNMTTISITLMLDVLISCFPQPEKGGSSAGALPSQSIRTTLKA
jgi:hypothetical protein